MVRTQDPVSPRRLRRSVPRDLETICLKCLRKNPDERYLSASLLSAELGRFLKQEPIMARPIGRFEKINLWCRRNPREAVLASLSLLVSVACFLAVLWAWQKTELAFESEKDRAANEKLQNEEAQRTATVSNRRFDKAAASAEELLRVSQRLLNQPNMDTLGRETFEKAMKFKQSLIEESSGADGTSLEIARALGGFAGTQAELGLFNEAAVTLQQSIAALQSLDESAEVRLELIRRYQIKREHDPKKRAHIAKIHETFLSLIGLSRKCDKSTKQLVLMTMDELLIGNARDMNAVAWFLVLPKSANVEDSIYATTLAARAIALQPEDATFHNTLGVALFRAGNLDEARAELEKSLSINTAWAGADWYILAMICHREGNTVEAVDFLKNAMQWRLDKQPNFADLKLLEAEAQELISVDGL